MLTLEMITKVDLTNCPANRNNYVSGVLTVFIRLTFHIKIDNPVNPPTSVRKGIIIIHNHSCSLAAQTSHIVYIKLAKERKTNKSARGRIYTFSSKNYSTKDAKQCCQEVNSFVVCFSKHLYYQKKRSIPEYGRALL